MTTLAHDVACDSHSDASSLDVSLTEGEHSAFARMSLGLAASCLAFLPSCVSTPDAEAEARIVDALAEKIAADSPYTLREIIRGEVSAALGEDAGAAVRREVTAALPDRVKLDEELREILRGKLQGLSASELETLVRAEINQELPNLVRVEEARLVQRVADTLLTRLAADARLTQALAHPNFDAVILRREMLEPVVRLNGDFNFGSGVLIQREQLPGTDSYRYKLLTSWHVVRDMIDSNRVFESPIAIDVFQSREVLKATAHVVKHDVPQDLALLEMESPHFLNVARFDRARAEGKVDVFSPVMAVGCPLGEDPIPTMGIVTDGARQVNGRTYMMIEAPTYFGNSGGGIFSLETGELEGIFSKIFTHSRSTVVTHLGLATPRDIVVAFVNAELPVVATDDEAFEMTGR
jgi:S1-C subfamily serine protease